VSGFLELSVTARSAVGALRSLLTRLDTAQSLGVVALLRVGPVPGRDWIPRPKHGRPAVGSRTNARRRGRRGEARATASLAARSDARTPASPAVREHEGNLAGNADGPTLDARGSLRSISDTFRGDGSESVTSDGKALSSRLCGSYG